MSILANWIVLVFNALYNSQNVYETLSVYDSMVKTIMQTDTFEALSSIIMTIGISMMLIYFFMDLSDKVTTKNFGTEQLFRAFMILFVSYVLLLYTDELIYGFLDLGLSLGQSFTGEDPTSSYFTSDRIVMLENGLDKIDLGGSIFHIAGLIFPYLLSLVANLSLFFIGITRIVELTVRSFLICTDGCNGLHQKWFFIEWYPLFKKDICTGTSDRSGCCHKYCDRIDPYKYWRRRR